MPRLRRIAIVIICFVGAFYLTTVFKSPGHSHEKATDAGLLEENEIYYNRMKHVEEACSNSLRRYTEEESYKMLSLNPELLNNILVSDKYEVLYCYVPKVACTNWKRIMLLLNSNNVTDFDKIPSDSVHRKNVFVKLMDLKEEEILQRLRSYDKFIFVRHPIERVISAFKNKFEKNYTSSQYFKERFGVAIQKKYRESDQISPRGDGVKFSEFVRYLMDTYESDPKRFNEHWAPASQLCHPCDVRYNLIGKYENLQVDSEHILRTINSPEELHFPPVKPSKTTSVVDDYVSTLSNDQFDGLMKIFGNDFKMFDYYYKRKVR